jgi:hypothetical protein
LALTPAPRWSEAITRAVIKEKRIRVDRDADHTPIHRLPRVHPFDQKRREAIEAAMATYPHQAAGTGRQVYRDRGRVHDLQ